MLNSPIAWVGGKRRLRESIISRIPKHTCYAEVFAGAAWVFFGKEASKVEVINDINGDLVNLYRVLQSDSEAFHEALWYLFPSRQLMREAHGILTNPEASSQLTEVERAVLFYYHIRNAFGAKFGGGFGFSSIRPPKKAVQHESLCALRDRLQGVYVENVSCERLIKLYDSKDTFFYCDPPYTSSDGTSDYQFVFSEEQHQMLRDALANSKGKFLLSYDESPFIRSLYKGFKVEKTKELRYTLNAKSGAKVKHELLISNF